MKNTQSLRTLLVHSAFIALLALVLPRLSFAQDPLWSDSYVTVTGGRALYSAPAIAEVDGDTSNGKEIVVAGNDGIITSLRSDGTELWAASTPDSGCGGRSRSYSSPAVGELFGDGVPYVVVGYGGFSKRCQGGVIALDGRNGSLRWNFSTKDFAKKEKFWAVLHNVFSTPALADTDGDGKMEIGFGSFDRSVYLLNADGSIRWYYQAADTVWSSPAFANIDSTPELEMIIGTDISQNKALKPATKNGGNLYAFRTKANPKKKYGFRDSKAYLWLLPLDQVLFSSPAVGDVLPSSPGLEIVINSGCYFPERTNQKGGRWTKIVSAKGKVLQTIPIAACSPSSPALGDLNNDGTPEIVVTVNGAGQVGGDGVSRVMAYNAPTKTTLWTIIPYFNNKNYSLGGNFISPTIADLDNNGSVEVVVPVSTGIGVYDGETGAALTCETGSCESTIKLQTGDVVLSTAAIGDVNSDGIIDIVAASKKGSSGAVYAWTNFQQSISSSAPAVTSPGVIWGMFKKDAGRKNH